MSATIDANPATKPELSFVVSAPYSQVHISDLDADDHIIMRVRQLSAILGAMPVTSYSEKMLQLVRHMAVELTAANTPRVSEAARS